MIKSHSVPAIKEAYQLPEDFPEDVRESLQSGTAGPLLTDFSEGENDASHWPETFIYIIQLFAQALVEKSVPLIMHMGN